MKAVPVSQKKSVQPENVKKLQRLPGSCSPSSSGPDLTFGGLPVPKLEATYEPMIVKEARYIAITMMKVSIVGLVYHLLTCFFTFSWLQILHKWKLIGLCFERLLFGLLAVQLFSFGDR